MMCSLLGRTDSLINSVFRKSKSFKLVRVIGIGFLRLAAHLLKQYLTLVLVDISVGYYSRDPFMIYVMSCVNLLVNVDCSCN